MQTLSPGRVECEGLHAALVAHCWVQQYIWMPSTHACVVGLAHPVHSLGTKPSQLLQTSLCGQELSPA